MTHKSSVVEIGLRTTYADAAPLSLSVRREMSPRLTDSEDGKVHCILCVFTDGCLCIVGQC